MSFSFGIDSCGGDTIIPARKGEEIMKDYRVGKAFGGPSHSVRRAVKKILKKAKAKKDTESVRDVRAEGGRSTKISKRGPVYNKNTGRKIIR